MFYNDYEDYMRRVLNYPNPDRNTYPIYENNYFPNIQSNNMVEGNNMPFVNVPEFNITDANEKINKMYPEIYRLINPIVEKCCNENNEPITQELVEKMVNEIYDVVEEQPDTVVNVNVEVSNREEKNIKERNIKQEENRNINSRRRNNFLLRDLIKILILNNLLRKNNVNIHPRPNYPNMNHSRQVMPRNMFF